jgi:hypothetical protein
MDVYYQQLEYYIHESVCVCARVCAYRHACTHTHTHIYIYIYNKAIIIKIIINNNNKAINNKNSYLRNYFFLAKDNKI